jgi:hypothetical protein
VTYTRYDCPVDGCDWHYDGDPSNTPPHRQTQQELSPKETTRDIMLTQAAREVAVAVDAALREHLESHDVVDWLRTIRRLKMKAQPSHPCYCGFPMMAPPDQPHPRGTGPLCKQEQG